jgi:hypothetical protein
MSETLLTFIDRVVDASMAPAARAMGPLIRDVREAVESSDGYDDADAALKRLEGKARADGLDEVLVDAMMNGTSAGGVEP